MSLSDSNGLATAEVSAPHEGPFVSCDSGDTVVGDDNADVDS